jgi:hypothetical protein
MVANSGVHERVRPEIVKNVRDNDATWYLWETSLLVLTSVFF